MKKLLLTLLLSCLPGMAQGLPVPAVITSPQNGSTIVGAGNQTVSWSLPYALDTYVLYVSHVGYLQNEAGTYNLGAGVTSQLVYLPLGTTYFTLYTWNAGNYIINESSVTVISQPSISITSPPNGSQLAYDSQMHVIWWFTSNVCQVNISIGTTGPGASDLFNNYQMNLCSYSGYWFPNISSSSGMIYVRLSVPGWYQDYTYLSPASGSASTGATWTPAPGSTDDYNPSQGFPSGSPLPVSVSPSSGSGTVQTFTYTAYDVNGTSDLTAALLQFQNQSIGVQFANSCFFWFSPASSGGDIYLMNDAGTSWMGATIGAPNQPTLSNSQCSVNVNAASGTFNNPTFPDSDHYTVTIPITFNPAWSGTKSAYAYVIAGPNGSSNSGWIEMGTWTVSGSSMLAEGPEMKGLKMTRSVRTSHGIIEVPKGDQIDIGTLTWKYAPSGDAFKYDYAFDNTQVANVRMGFPDEEDLSAESTKPAGWQGSGFTWFAWEHATYSKSAPYSVKSKWRPGVVPMYFQADVDGTTAAANGGRLRPLPNMLKSRDNEALASAISIFHNSVQRFVIGPVFPKGATHDEVLEKVKGWIDVYGFHFLQPLLSGVAPKDLKPTSDIERQIVECLTGVWN